jgi:apolipoprotein D and lipocalin family protein
MKVIIFSAVIVLLAVASRAQAAPKRECPPIPPTVSELDLAQYGGVWYQSEGVPQFFQPEGTECITANYGLYENGTAITVWNTGLKPGFQEFDEICGKAVVADPNMPGELIVSFETIAFPATEPNYFILGTDYDNYAAVYSCTDSLFGPGLTGWILTRSQTPSAETIEQARSHFTDNDHCLSFLGW